MKHRIFKVLIALPLLCSVGVSFAVNTITFQCPDRSHLFDYQKDGKSGLQAVIQSSDGRTLKIAGVGGTYAEKGSAYGVIYNPKYGASGQPNLSCYYGQDPTDALSTAMFSDQDVSALKKCGLSPDSMSDTQNSGKMGVTKIYCEVDG